jgi:dipeptidyl aminopeptidase/acylaminoacyl peptidase
MRKILFLSLAVVAIMAAQQLTPEMVINKTLAISPKMHPGGDWIAYSQYSFANSDSAEGGKSELFVVNRRSKEKRQFSFSPMSFSAYEWSRDGQHLYFRAKITEFCMRHQLYRMPLNGGGIERVSYFKDSFSRWQMAPDESYITFLRRPKANKFDPLTNDRDLRFAQLYKYDINGKNAAVISPDSLHVWDYAISPDGGYAIIQATKDAGVDYSYMFRQLYKVDFATRAVTPLLSWEGKMGPAKISPDGRYLAVMGAVDMSDPTEGSLFLVDMQQPLQRQNLTPGFAGTVESFYWTDDDEMVFMATVNAHREMWRVDTDGDLRREKSFSLNFSSLSFDAKNEYFAVSATAYNHPHEIFVGRVGRDLDRITMHNPEFAKIEFSKPEEIKWTARDGLEMYGLLYKPLTNTAGTPAPLQVYVHGGPESAVVLGWNNWYSNWPQLLAQKGAYVFMPNYRASTGQGVAFSKADHKDMMGKEFDDILDGINMLVAQGYVDEERVGLGGGSYGGYAAAWAATRHSEHFAAAIMFVGISNQVSKFGTTDTPWESASVHWAAWPYDDDNMDLFWDRSPLKWASQNQTPIFIASGELDERVPPEQGKELYRALRHHDQAPVEFVIYQGEGHGNRKKGNREHFMLHSLKWLDTYLFGN